MFISVRSTTFIWNIIWYDEWQW